MGSKNRKRVGLHSFCPIGKSKECASSATDEVGENGSLLTNTLLSYSFLFEQSALMGSKQSLEENSLSLWRPGSPPQGLFALLWGWIWTGVCLHSTWMMLLCRVGCKSVVGWSDLLDRARQKRGRVYDHELQFSTLIGTIFFIPGLHYQSR